MTKRDSMGQHLNSAAPSPDSGRIAQLVRAHGSGSLLRSPPSTRDREVLLRRSFAAGIGHSESQSRYWNGLHLLEWPLRVAPGREPDACR